MLLKSEAQAILQFLDRAPTKGLREAQVLIQLAEKLAAIEDVKEEEIVEEEA